MDGMSFRGHVHVAVCVSRYGRHGHLLLEQHGASVVEILMATHRSIMDTEQTAEQDDQYCANGVYVDVADHIWSTKLRG